MRSRALAIALVAAALPALSPGEATAATAEISGDQLRVAGAGTERNGLEVIVDGSDLRIFERGSGPLTPGPGCTAVTAQEVICDAAAVATISVAGWAGDDMLANRTAVPATLDGGDGDDGMKGGSAADRLTGGAGNDFVTYDDRTTAVVADLEGDADDGAPLPLPEGDQIDADVETLYGGSASDTLTGNDADNGLDGGAGADILNGGAGNDYALYWLRDVPVSVTFDGLANDGQAGENDVLGPDVESAIGGVANDTLAGGASANVLIGAYGDDSLRGAGGDDTLYGSDGVDIIDGGAEDDLLDGGSGPDALDGGDGTDRVSYASRLGSVTVDLDGLEDDGGVLESDRVGADVESITGGSGGDRLTGNGAPNQLTGGPGADTLDGAGGDDELDGGADADALIGGEGTDRVSYAGRAAGVSVTLDGLPGDGEAGENDDLRGDVEGATGGAGDDALTGGAGPNTLTGGPGDDTLQARDGGFDELACGDHTDSVVIDRVDLAGPDCELIDQPPAPQAPAPPAPSPAPEPKVEDPADAQIAQQAERKKVEIGAQPITITPDGRVPIKLRCPAGRRTSCRGTIKIFLPRPKARRKPKSSAGSAKAAAAARPRRREQLLAKKTFKIDSGKSKVVQVKLSRNGRQRVLRGRRQRCRVSVSLPGPKGRTIVSTRTITLKAPKTEVVP